MMSNYVNSSFFFLPLSKKTQSGDVGKGCESQLEARTCHQDDGDGDEHEDGRIWPHPSSTFTTPFLPPPSPSFLSLKNQFFFLSPSSLFSFINSAPGTLLHHSFW